MLPFGVTIPASAPLRSETPEGLMNYTVYISYIDSVILISVGTEMVHGKVVFM
jgi:hypothetical protein